MDPVKAVVFVMVAAFTVIALDAVFGNTGHNWLANCAVHRPLADCKADYEKLSQ